MSFSVNYMPQAKLLIPDEIVELIRNLHPDLKKRIRSSLMAILHEPAIGKALKDELAGLLSYRVKRFRIIYRIKSRNQIQIIAIGPRKYIYEETFKQLKKK